MKIKEQHSLQYNEHGQPPHEIPVPDLVVEQPHSDYVAESAAHERQPHQP